MNTTLVFSMIGPDRLGIVDELTQLLLQVDGNVETSRMARLGGEFAMLLQVSLPEGNVPRLEQLTEPLNDQGYAITWKATGSSSPATAGGCNYYRLSVAGADHEGIIHSIAHYLSGHGINIEVMDTNTSRAPESGALLFSMQAGLCVPPRLGSDRWQQELQKIGHQENVEIELHAA